MCKFEVLATSVCSLASLQVTLNQVCRLEALCKLKVLPTGSQGKLEVLCKLYVLYDEIKPWFSFIVSRGSAWISCYFCELTSASKLLS